MIEKLDLKITLTYLKPRPRDAHKGLFGHVLVVGGNIGMSGAVRLAGEAALRVGAGLVSIATRIEHASILNSERPELMCHGISNASDLTNLIQKATVIVIGPGLGQTEWSKNLLQTCLESTLPLIVDADALNLLSLQLRDNWILTPHPGEAARLSNWTISDVQKDRPKAIQMLQERLGGVCVLKGANTLVLGTTLTSCPYGNPGMASGGMGDLLSGVIGGLVAQGLSLEQAAQLGVCVHACAGDQAAQDGERGLIATDLLPHIRRLINAPLD